MVEKTIISGIDELKTWVGKELGVSDWHLVTQEEVNLFADATGDHQWIHVNPEMAKLSPFGTTIAHGYFTLSLGPVLLGSFFSLNGVKMGLNYGCNRVRFPSPVKVGSKLRLRASVISVDEIDGGAQSTLNLVFECEGEPKPSCVAEVIFRYYA